MRDILPNTNPSNESNMGPQPEASSARWGQVKDPWETKKRTNADLTAGCHEELAIASGARLVDAPRLQVP